MAPKKKVPSKRGLVRTEVNVRAAMASGRSVGEEVIVFRAKQCRKRAAIEITDQIEAPETDSEARLWMMTIGRGGSFMITPIRARHRPGFTYGGPAP